MPLADENVEVPEVTYDHLTFSWTVTGLKKDINGTVVQVYWTKTGVDSEGREGTFNGATPLEGDPSDEGFISFDSLTEDDVLSWIKNVVVDDYANHVNGTIQRQIDRQSITMATMPWAPVEESTSD
jgi:hypothetical protein